MNVESLAVLAVEACEASKVDYMMTGARWRSGRVWGSRL